MHFTEPTPAILGSLALTHGPWSAHGVNIEDVIKEVEADDRYVGMQLRLIHAFGLRNEEAVMFRPYRAHKSTAAGEYIELTKISGAKGGRTRVVPVTNDYQRAVLAAAKALAGTVSKRIGNPKLTLKQQLKRFSYIMYKHNVTKARMGTSAHGLRHQYLNNRHEGD